MKATTTKAVTTSKKPSATKTATREPVTVYQPVTQTVIIVHEGTTVVQTQTVTQVSPPAPTSNNGWPSGGWTCRGDGKDGFEVDHNGKGCPAQYPSGWLWFG